MLKQRTKLLELKSKDMYEINNFFSSCNQLLIFYRPTVFKEIHYVDYKFKITT